MNTNQLRYFVTAAECRSFTKAADQFYITQTAITQQIHALEDSLGVPLFDRSSRPISLTPAGSAFLSDARSILGRIDQAVNRIQEVSTGMVGTLGSDIQKALSEAIFPTPCVSSIINIQIFLSPVTAGTPIFSPQGY